MNQQKHSADHSTAQLMSHLCEGTVCQGSAAQTHTLPLKQVQCKENLFFVCFLFFFLSHMIKVGRRRSCPGAGLLRHIPFARLLFLRHGGLAALRAPAAASSAAAGVQSPLEGGTLQWSGGGSRVSISILNHCYLSISN